jgi:hypothetical protein
LSYFAKHHHPGDHCQGHHGGAHLFSFFFRVKRNILAALVVLVMLVALGVIICVFVFGFGCVCVCVVMLSLLVVVCWLLVVGLLLVVVVVVIVFPCSPCVPILSPLAPFRGGRQKQTTDSCPICSQLAALKKKEEQTTKQHLQ